MNNSHAPRTRVSLVRAASLVLATAPLQEAPALEGDKESGAHPPGSVRIIDRPVEGLADAILAGEIDAAVLWEPWTARLRQNLGGEANELPGGNVYTAKWVVVARRSTVQEHPERSRAVLAVYRDAIDIVTRRTGDKPDSRD